MWPPSDVLQLWRVTCGQCGSHQGINHARLAHLLESKATQDSLLCANPGCPLSRHQHRSASLADLREQERHETQRTAEAERLAAIEAEQQRQKDAKVEALKNQWRTYYRHQLKTQIKVSDIASWQRWQTLSPGTREMVMQALYADPTLYFTRW